MLDWAVYMGAAIQASVFGFVKDTFGWPADMTVIEVPDTRLALALISTAWFGEPAEAIGRSLGMTRNAVSVRLHRTRNRLRDYLSKEGFTP